MTRFVRIYHNERDDPGSRLRLEYDPEGTDAFCLADENVLPEKTFDENAQRVVSVACIELDRDAVRWARDALIELCKHLDAEEQELPPERCPHGNMPREAGAGHWRDWHRGHGCHLDPDVHPKKGTP